MFITLLILLLLSMLVGALPLWEHSRRWGYFPSGGFGVVVLVLILLLITGRI
jgi:Protein of unknown function (DUF3309)